MGLEKPCGRCAEAGHVPDGGGAAVCPECCGRRAVPTPLGAALLEFLCRHTMGAGGRGGIVRRRGA